MKQHCESVIVYLYMALISFRLNFVGTVYSEKKSVNSMSDPVYDLKFVGPLEIKFVAHIPEQKLPQLSVKFSLCVVQGILKTINFGLFFPH